jgi:hypothetical protein
MLLAVGNVNLRTPEGSAQGFPGGKAGQDHTEGQQPWKGSPQRASSATTFAVLAEILLNGRSLWGEDAFRSVEKKYNMGSEALRPSRK